MKNKNYRFLSVSIGIVYLWFGVLKFFPNLSPAEGLARDTISALTFDKIPSNISIILLAIWESLVGILLIVNICIRKVIIVALAHMAFTFTPLFLFPRQAFVSLPFQFTLLGQYIFKNIVIITSLLILRKQFS